MVNFKFQNWCRKAVSRIVYVPDRITVGRELYHHLQDCCEEYLAQGLSQEEAENRALEAMGPAENIAPELGALHRPFWGLFHQATKRTLGILAAAAALCFATYLLCSFVLFETYSKPTYTRFNPYTDQSVSDQAGQLDRLLYAAPDTTVISDGYRITLTQYALWDSRYIDNKGKSQQEQLLYFQLKVTNPLPWSAHTDIGRWFWAQDDLGNHYYAAYENGSMGTNSIEGNWYHTGPLTYQHNMWLSDFISQDARWIDLHYNRDGRDLVLRISLTGGDRQ